MNQQTLCYYVAYLAKRNLSPATIKVYLYHIASDVPEPDRAKMQKLKIVSNGITRVSALKTKETHTRLPITPDILRRIYRLWQPNRHEFETILMWAVSTLCFFGFFRMGELTIPNDTAYDYSMHLSPGDIATDSHTNPTMLQVHLKTSQGSQRHNSNCRQNKRPTMPSQRSFSLPCHKRGHTRTIIPTGKWSTPYKDTLYP